MKKSTTGNEQQRPKPDGTLVTIPEIEARIFSIRSHRVMLDRDLAGLYGVTTGNLNKAVARNRERFPEDFMFQLTAGETDLIFQPGRSSRHGGSRFNPYVFTQEGIAMLSSVLRSPRAVEVNIAIMRAFVRLREMLLGNRELAAKLGELEAKLENQGKDIHTLFSAIRQLMAPPVPQERRIKGFGK